MRISVIGLPGSGKSTLAETISKKLVIPHIHLDRFWFEAGGRNGAYDTPNIEQVRIHVRDSALAAIEQEAWVSDGFYNRLQPEITNRANVVIFLDTSLWQRLRNHARRFVHRDTRHKEIGVWDDLTFFLEIVRRTFTTGPKLRRFINKHRDKVITLKSRKEIDEYLRNIN